MRRWKKHTKNGGIPRAKHAAHHRQTSQPIKNEKIEELHTLSLSLSLSLCRQFSAAPGCPAPLRRENMVTDLFISHCLLQKKYYAVVRFPEARGTISGLSNRCRAGGIGTKPFVFTYRKIDAFTLVPNRYLPISGRTQVKNVAKQIKNFC